MDKDLIWQLRSTAERISWEATTPGLYGSLMRQAADALESLSQPEGVLPTKVDDILKRLGEITQEREFLMSQLHHRSKPQGRRST